jgi:hypothetical protein
MKLLKTILLTFKPIILFFVGWFGTIFIGITMYDYFGFWGIGLVFLLLIIYILFDAVRNVKNEEKKI